MKKKKSITRKQIEFIIKRYRLRIGPWTLTDGLLSVNGNVKICHIDIKQVPLRFKYVYGDFIISSNKLTSLVGCPQYVAGDFNCYGNNLTSLRYCPAEIGGSFLAHENRLTSLKGTPKIINGNFSCSCNDLTSLADGPIKVNGFFYGFKNKLNTLEGSPEYVGGSFRVEANEITNLVGVPKVIGGIFGFDSSTSLYMGNQDCKVKRIEIQSQERVSKSEKVLPQIIIDNKKNLPIVFKYMHFLDLFTPQGTFNKSNFDDIIMDIKEGLL
ncbi:hypothetical protein E0I26_04085 [Flavobacterium rhamnosiphilum]|uniref:Leucine rich repeat-containing protein n=1 Tax=Flavobacterium rhamnosiphilum TaxID=2541724 RepID=A0A4R5FAI9_9FLAO|nr:hypothetical protein [Flavobacterium rhamnosiphilum]TDE45875.1 hypothetical protein E0I26_04085 [Flavobacterium rhamnosiphilum]